MVGARSAWAIVSALATGETHAMPTCTVAHRARPASPPAGAGDARFASPGVR